MPFKRQSERSPAGRADLPVFQEGTIANLCHHSPVVMIISADSFAEMNRQGRQETPRTEERKKCPEDEALSFFALLLIFSLAFSSTLAIAFAECCSWPLHFCLPSAFVTAWFVLPEGRLLACGFFSPPRSLSSATATAMRPHPRCAGQQRQCFQSPSLDRSRRRPRCRRRQKAPLLVVRSGKKTGFLAGADLHDFLAISDTAAAEAISATGQRLFDKLAALPMPTIAAISGPCLGGGLELALACDYRLVFDKPKTQLGLPEVSWVCCPAGAARNGCRASSAWSGACE